MRLASFSKNTFGRASVILLFALCLVTESPALAGHPNRRQPHHPPRGAVVHHLPAGFYALLIAGMTYFVFSEIYYQRVPSGYMVVDPPPRETIQAAVGKWVVDTSELNVRSGPGLNKTLLFFVRMGDRLLIQGLAPAWYYVQLPNGSHGWVMSKFTRTLAPMPNG